MRRCEENMGDDVFRQEISEVVARVTDLSAGEVLGLLELPRDRKLGDIALPCFVFAKKLKRSPQELASQIDERLQDAEWHYIAQVRAVGPYVNFFYDTGELARAVIGGIWQAPETYGCSDEGGGETIVIDFSSPNIAKPFGVGHLRSTVLGNALYTILEKRGYKCVGVNHLGDWGTQFGKMIVAFKRWGSEEMLKKDPVYALYDLYTRFHREAKNHPALEEDARKEFRLLEEGDPEALALWDRFKEYSLAEFNRIYDVLGIRFDYHTGESFYNDKMERVLEILDERNLTEISNEALIVDLESYGLGACLLKKGDEATLYATRDLAGIMYRHDTFGFTKCLYVVNTAQSLHFKQVFKVIELAGFDYHEGLVHVPFGWIRFADKAMSTREGNIVFLEEVISKATKLAMKIILDKNPDIEDVDRTAQDIGVGAVVFAQLSVRRMKDIDFRWEDALSFDGETGPYLQYTHARLCSLSRKYGKDIPREIDYKRFRQPEEKNVLMMLAQYPERVELAAREYEPFVISSYLINLAQEFNAFYQKHRVITDDTALTDARILLADSVRIVLSDGLRILGLIPLERM